MPQDTRADAPLPDHQGGGSDSCDDLGRPGENPGMTEELLVEEVSIDGMCGVY